MTRPMRCACGQRWPAPAARPAAPMRCPGCQARVCGCGCGADLDATAMKANAIYAGRACALRLKRYLHSLQAPPKPNRRRTRDGLGTEMYVVAEEIQLIRQGLESLGRVSQRVDRLLEKADRAMERTARKAARA